MHAEDASNMIGTDIDEGIYLFQKVMPCCKSDFRC